MNALAKSRKSDKTTEADSVETTVDKVADAKMTQESDMLGDADPVDETVARQQDDAPDGDDVTPLQDPDPEKTGDPEATKQQDEDKDDTAKQDPDTDETAAQKSQDAMIQHPVPVPVQEVRSTSIWPAVFGGVIAAMIGFIAGRGDQLDAYLPASMQRQTVDISGLESQADEIAASVVANNDAVTARLEALENQTPDDSQTIALAEMNAEMSAALDAALARIATLENRPEPVAPTPSEPGVAAEEVEALQAALDAQRAELEALKNRTDAAESAAQGEAARLLARAALTRVITAVETGDTFEPALGDLEQVTPVEVPDALRDAASNGVPTLAALREDFPKAARAALQAAHSETPESDVQGITAFLRRQLSARSVAPREGDDPDAILSRAEAAVKDGDLTTALTEMDALPDASKTAMQDWLAAAAARKSVQDAARALSDSLQDN